jgi:hypothetical protein
MEPARSPWNRPVNAKVHFGSEAAAFGAFGASVDVAPIRHVAIDVGAGVGRGSVVGAALLRGRGGDDSIQIGLGGGISTGPARDDKNSCGAVSGAFIFPVGGCAAMREFGSREIERAWFAVGELTFEARSSAGFHGGLAVGWAHLLNRASDWRCLDQCENVMLPSRDRLYVDLAFGWAFG